MATEKIQQIFMGEKRADFHRIKFVYQICFSFYIGVQSYLGLYSHNIIKLKICLMIEKYAIYFMKLIKIWFDKKIARHFLMKV